MATNYFIIHHMWNWLKKLFFHLLDLMILNSYICLSVCHGQKLREIHLYLTRNMLAYAVKQPCLQRMLGRPVNDVIRTGRLGTNNKYCIVPVKQVPILEHSGSEFTSKVRLKCLKCEVSLCVDKNCFLECHMKMHLKKVQQTHNW
jgi:hypothetical protein